MHTLYVVSHGWHSGIVVRRDEPVNRRPMLGPDLGTHADLEIGWGKERFYQARETTVGMALRAVLWPRTSVLQVVPFSGAPQRYFANEEVAELRTDDAGYAAVLEFIAASFTPELRRLGSSLYGDGWFYAAEGDFYLFDTCNRWVARALDKASCLVR